MKLNEAKQIAEALAQARASYCHPMQVAAIDLAIHKVALAISDMTSETASEAEYRIGLFTQQATAAPTHKPRTYHGGPKPQLA